MATTYLFFYLMLVSANPAEPPRYIKLYENSVDCEIRRIELKKSEPKENYKCMPLKSHVDLRVKSAS